MDKDHRRPPLKRFGREGLDVCTWNNVLWSELYGKKEGDEGICDDEHIDAMELNELEGKNETEKEKERERRGQREGDREGGGEAEGEGEGEDDMVIEENTKKDIEEQKEKKMIFIDINHNSINDNNSENSPQVKNLTNNSTQTLKNSKNLQNLKDSKKLNKKCCPCPKNLPSRFDGNENFTLDFAIAREEKYVRTFRIECMVCGELDDQKEVESAFHYSKSVFNKNDNNNDNNNNSNDNDNIDFNYKKTNKKNNKNNKNLSVDNTKNDEINNLIKEKNYIKEQFVEYYFTLLKSFISKPPLFLPFQIMLPILLVPTGRGIVRDGCTIFIPLKSDYMKYVYYHENRCKLSLSSSRQGNKRLGEWRGVNLNIAVEKNVTYNQLEKNILSLSAIIAESSSSVSDSRSRSRSSLLINDNSHDDNDNNNNNNDDYYDHHILLN